MDTFFEFCYIWCSVLDPVEGNDVSLTAETPLLLQHAIASVASPIRPPLLHGVSSSSEHYERARHLFHSGRTTSATTLLKAAVLLSYTNNPVPSSSTDTSFWWTGVAVRLAQDLHLHRQSRIREGAGVLRRTWWTLYARERVVALCQGRPCMIDEDYCDTSEPQLSDFPPNKSFEAQVFVHWVKLGRVMGQIQKRMLHTRRSGEILSTPLIAASLTEWIRSLSAPVQLSIANAETTNFQRDVHLLHLPYMTSVALTYMITTGQSPPQISIAAVLAATSTARIFRDFLLRGSIAFLPEDVGWYIAIAVTALSFLYPFPNLETHASADIRILLTALEHMSAVWTSSKVLLAGLKRFLENYQHKLSSRASPSRPDASNAFVEDDAQFLPGGKSLFDLMASDGVLWSDLFPFASANTSPLFKALITENYDSGQFANMMPDFAELLDSFWEDFAAEPSEWARGVG